MGNDFERKFRVAKPKEIDFPTCEKKHSINLKVVSEKNKEKALKNNSWGRSIFLLKSGNILVSLVSIEEKSIERKYINTIYIYSIPDLKIVNKYIFPDGEFEEEEGGEDIIFTITRVIQLKSGNIFVFYDKFYEFDGENIEDGPKRSIEIKEGLFTNYNSISYKDPFDKKKIIQKHNRFFPSENLIEAIDGKLLYTNINKIYCIDTKNTEYKETVILTENLGIDIMFISEYYPDYIYIIKNFRDNYQKKACSELSVYNVNDLCNSKVNSIFKIGISNSENTYAYCEYNKKYLLFDTLAKGIYIFDIEARSKVAVCNVKIETRGIFSYSERGYKNMIKLEDGQIVRIDDNVINIIDIREETITKGCYEAVRDFVNIDKYIVFLRSNSYIFVEQLYD